MFKTQKGKTTVSNLLSSLRLLKVGQSQGLTLCLPPLPLGVVLLKSIPATLLTSPVLGSQTCADFDEAEEYPHCPQLPSCQKQVASNNRYVFSYNLGGKVQKQGNLFRMPFKCELLVWMAGNYHVCYFGQDAWLLQTCVSASETAFSKSQMHF